VTFFGVHPQNTDLASLRLVWRTAEELGYGWISVWDHFATSTSTGDNGCLDAVALQAALASETSRVTCGSLVYSIGFRHPAVLASAITAIDHISGGRAAIGIGAGWRLDDYQGFGLPFPPVADRLDQVEEGLQVLKALLHQDQPADYAGKWFQLREAQTVPRPLQPRIPIWLGGGGERRSIPLAARFADGWNLAVVSPEVFAQKRAVLHQACERLGRDPGEIATSVLLNVAWTQELLDQQLADYGDIAEQARPGFLTGSEAQVADRVGQYVDAGADGVVLNMRAPFDIETIERFAMAVGLT
jgi:alkanesulfonate monooxygenase SsuD/methylene tetrahydromethanopterin reductase-like flavin-dependent oxidoreductase (luciferase family)